MDLFEQEEEWRSVIGYEGYYEVSNKGRVRRGSAAGKSTYAGRPLKPWANGQGRLSVGLCVDGKRTSHSVHRLVARAFLGEPPDDERVEIDHINNDPTDNRPGNLEWVTRSENMRRAHEDKLLANAGGIKITPRGAQAIRHLNDEGVSYNRLAKAFDVHYNTIAYICQKAA